MMEEEHNKMYWQPEIKKTDQPLKMVGRPLQECVADPQHWKSSQKWGEEGILNEALQNPAVVEEEKGV